VIDSQVRPNLHLKRIGIHLSRPRSQRGELSDSMPKRGRLARGRYWARWRFYIRQADGRETVKRAEKIVDRALAEELGFVLDYAGPLTKTGARKVLEALIRDSNNRPAAFTTKTTFGDVAREYIDLNKPNWEASTSRVNVQLIEDHLIAKLGGRPVRELSDSELQRFLNAFYVEQGASRSFLAKLGLFLRAILKRAVDRDLIPHNPARKLRAKSRKRACNLAHTLEECDLLLSQVSGADHLAIRLLIQLGLRSEELFALRRNDVQSGGLVIDEAIVDGEAKGTRTVASARTFSRGLDVFTITKKWTSLPKPRRVGKPWSQQPRQSFPGHESRDNQRPCHDIFPPSYGAIGYLPPPNELAVWSDGTNPLIHGIFLPAYLMRRVRGKFIGD
jgi:hypothetical protein